MKSFFSCVILLILISCNSFSNPYPFKVWSNVLYNSHFATHPDLLYGFLLEGRFDRQPGLFYQALIQTQLGYRAADNMRLWMGYTYIPNTVVQPSGRVSTITQRLYQQAEVDLIKNLRYEVMSRSRIEERYRRGEHDLGLVYRQLFILRLPRFIIHNTFTPYVSNEVIFNMSKPVWSNQKHFNQNRSMLGVTFPCIGHTCQLAYMNQFQANRLNHDSNNILFFSFII